MDWLAVPGFRPSPNRGGAKARKSQSSQSRKEWKGNARQGIVRQWDGRKGVAETPRLTRLAVPGFRPGPNRTEAKSRNSQPSQPRRERKGNERKGNGME